MADDVLTETDAESDRQTGAGTGSGELPSPLRPQVAPPIRMGAPPAPADDQYEIIEVDEQGKELGAPQPVGGAEPAAPAPAAAAPLPPDSELEYAPRPEFDANGQPQRPSKREQRQRRKEGRERTFAENAMLRAEMQRIADENAALRQQVETIAPRVVELGESEVRNRVANMTSELENVQRQFESAEDKFLDAMTSGDREAARAASRDRDALAIRRFQLTEAKRQVEENLSRRGTRDATLSADGRAPTEIARQPVQQPRQPVQQQPMRLTPQAEALRADFIENDAPWLNTPGNEFDANILAQIDDQVAREGYNPATNDYWETLYQRAQQYLPHRFAAESAAAPAAPTAPPRRAAAAPQPAPIRRGPPTAAPAAPTVQPNRNQVRIDPGRKDALIELGVLAPNGTVLDKTRFTRIVKQYAEFDRANGAGR